MKICIIGPSGAGKSTVANKLAQELNLTLYAFDEIYWDLSGTEFIRNSEEAMLDSIKCISQNDDWIVEGAYDKRMYSLLNQSTLILKMKVPFWLRTIRLFWRFTTSYVRKKQPRETFWNTIRLIYFSYTFEKRLTQFIERDIQLSKKVFIFHNFSSGMDIIRTEYIK